MKCAISFCLLLYSMYTEAMIKIYYSPETEQNMQMVKDIFTQKYSIPPELIQTQRILVECENVNRDKLKILELCLTKKGELRLLSLNKSMLENAFSIFRSPEDK